MKLQKVSQYKSPSFGSIPLYKASLVQKKFFQKAQTLDAFVSIIEKSDMERTALDYRKWWFSRFGNDIIESAEETLLQSKKKYRKFLMVEIPSLKPSKQVRAIAEYFLGTDNLILGLLQSKNETSFFSATKGAGSLILYALSKIAKQEKLNTISLECANGASKFYEKLGFKNTGRRLFILPSSDFGVMQSHLENKYNIVSI